MKKVLAAVMTLALLPSVFSQTITLKAKNYDGKTTYFVKRESSWEGEEVWGIKGEGTTGEVHTGDMWFNSFSGATGTYKVEFGVVLEPDGNPEYAVTAGSRLIKKSRYPYPSGQSTYLCSGGSSQKHWIDLGNHTINNGEKINVWGKSLYYCGSGSSWHGAYTRWFEVKFTLQGGTPVDATDITSPSAGASLEEGKEYTLTAEGENVSWSYDANSDGKAAAVIGTGNSVKFTIPSGVTGAREITFTATGDNGTDEITCSIGATGILDVIRGSEPARFGLTAGPDPFTRGTTVSFRVPDTGNTAVSLLRADGTRVLELTSGIRAAGAHTVRLERTAGMDAGVYFLVLEHTAGTQVRRIMAAD